MRLVPTFGKDFDVCGIRHRTDADGVREVLSCHCFDYIEKHYRAQTCYNMLAKDDTMAIIWEGVIYDNRTIKFGNRWSFFQSWNGYEVNI